jgi:hypothetical protein
VCPKTEAKVGEKQRAKDARACTTAWVSEWVSEAPTSKQVSKEKHWSLVRRKQTKAKKQKKKVLRLQYKTSENLRERERAEDKLQRN